MSSKVGAREDSKQKTQVSSGGARIGRGAAGSSSRRRGGTVLDARFREASKQKTQVLVSSDSAMIEGGQAAAAAAAAAHGVTKYHPEVGARHGRVGASEAWIS